MDAATQSLHLDYKGWRRRATSDGSRHCGVRQRRRHGNGDHRTDLAGARGEQLLLILVIEFDGSVGDIFFVEFFEQFKLVVAIDHVFDIAIVVNQRFLV